MIQRLPAAPTIQLGDPNNRQFSSQVGCKGRETPFAIPMGLDWAVEPCHQRVLVEGRRERMQAGAHQALQFFGSEPGAAGTPLTRLRLESPAPGQTPAAGPQHPESIRNSPEGFVALELPIPAGQPVPFGFAEIPVFTGMTKNEYLLFCKFFL